MKQTSALLRAAALAPILVCAALPLHATDRIDAAWDAALSEREDVLTDAQLADLNTVAYHSAVARLCDGFELDDAKIAAATNAILAAGPANLDGDQMMARQADILITLGTIHGILLAEGALNLDTFCAEAAEARADPEFANFWQ